MATTDIRQRKILSNLILNMFKTAIRIYQLAFSTLLHFISLGTVGGGCRFYPSCSEYSILVLDKHGLHLISFKKICSRLLRCQPFIKFKNKKNCGYDPVE